MDLIIYCSIIVFLAFKKISSDEELILDTSVSDNNIAIYSDIPVGSNLKLLKIRGAYTAILKELRLDKC